MCSWLSRGARAYGFHYTQLEYETERAGTFEPLRWLPRSKSVVLGLVSSKFPVVRCA